MSTSYRDMLVDLKNLDTRPMFYTGDKSKTRDKKRHEDIFVTTSKTKSWNDSHFEERKEFSEDISSIKDELKSNRDQLQQMFRYVDNMANAIPKMGTKTQSNDEKEQLLVERLNTERLILKEAYQASRMESKKNRSEKNNLKEELDKLRNQISTEKESLTVECKRVRGIYSALQSEYTKLRESYQSSSEVKVNIDEAVQVSQDVDERQSSARQSALQSSTESLLVKVNELKHQLTLKTKEIDTLNDQLERVTKENIAELRTADDKISVLKKDLENSIRERKELSQLLKTDSASNDQMKVYVEKISDLNNQVRFLTDRLTTVEQDYETLLKEKNDLSTSLKSAEIDRENHKDKVTAIDAEMKAILDQKIAADNECKRLRSILDKNEKLFSSQLKSTEQSAHGYEKQIESLKSVLEETKNQMLMAEKDCKHLKDLLDKKHDKLSSEELDTAVEKLKLSEQECKRLNSLLKKNEEHLVSKDKLIEQIKLDYEKKIKILNEELDLVRKQNSSSNEKCVQLNAVLKEKEFQLVSNAALAMQTKVSYEEKINTLNQQLIAIRDQKLSSDEECKKMTDLLNSQKEIISKNQVNTEEKDKLQSKYDRVLSKCNNLEQQMKNLNEEKAKIQEEKVLLEKKQNNIKDNKEMLTEEIKYIKNDLIEKEKIIKCMEMEKNVIANSAKTYQNQVEGLRSQIHEAMKAQEEVEDLKNQLIEAKEKENGWKQVEAKHEQKIQNLQKQLDNTSKSKNDSKDLEVLKKKLNENEKKQERYEKEKKISDENIKKLKHDLDKMTQNHQGAEKEITGLEKVQLDLSDELMKVMQECERLQNNNNELLDKMRDIETENESLKMNRENKKDLVESNSALFVKEKDVDVEDLVIPTRNWGESFLTESKKKENSNLTECYKNTTNSDSYVGDHLSLMSSNESLTESVNESPDVEVKRLPNKLEPVSSGNLKPAKVKKGKSSKKSSKKSLPALPVLGALRNIPPSSSTANSTDVSLKESNSYPDISPQSSSLDLSKNPFGSLNKNLHGATPLGSFKSVPSAGNSKPGLAELSPIRGLKNTSKDITPIVSKSSSLDGAPSLVSVKDGQTKMNKSKKSVSFDHTQGVADKKKEKPLTAEKPTSLKNLPSLGQKQNSFASIPSPSMKPVPSLNGNQSSLADMPSLGGKKSILTNMPSLGGKQASLAGVSPVSKLTSAPSLAKTQSSLADMPSLGGKKTSIANMPSLGGKQASLAGVSSVSKLTSAPLLAKNQSSLADMPSLGGKQSSLAPLKNNSSLKGSQSSLASIPSLGKTQSSLKNMPSLGGKQSNLKELPSLGGKQKIKKVAPKKKTIFKEELNYDDFDDGMEYGDCDIDDLLGDLL